jgi:outer membrane biosynthesis protein TonB
LVPLDPDPGSEQTSGGDPDAEPTENADGEDDRTTVEQPPEEPAAPTPQPITPTTRPVGRDPQTATANAAGRPIDEHWDDGGTMDEATMAGSPPGENLSGTEVPEEMTIEEGRPTLARLVVIAGNDTGREFMLSPGKSLSIGRAIENDIVLTDIAVSRKHLDVAFEIGHWILKDRGSGNGTLINDRLEDGQIRLAHGDKIEIGHTVFRFDNAGTSNAVPALGWGTQNDDEASTVAGRSPPRPTTKGPPPAVVLPSAAAGKRGQPQTQPPPLPAGARPTLPPPRTRSPSQGSVVGPSTTSAANAAVSQRLALPANPNASGPVMLGDAPATMSPQQLSIASTIDRLDRSMTATAHVEPLSYSGSMPPALPYAYAVPPMPRGKRIAIAAGIAVGVTLIGIIAMITTGDEPRSSSGTTTAAVRDGAPTPSKDPGTAVASADHDATPPAPDPLPIKAADPVPVPVPDPVPPKVEPKKVEPVPVPVPAKVEPKKIDPPKIEPKKVDPPKKVDKVAKVEPRKVVKTDKVDKADKKPASTAATKKKAAALYASKDFKGAAALCRDAASAADAGDAAEMKKLAASYDKLGDSLNAGNAASGSKPTDALAAYRRALAADKALGGTHASMIRDKLGQVAPKAAAGFMAKGNYEAAKQAADTAVNFGAGSSPTITQVRQSLERKAGELYASGMKQMSSAPEDAKALLRRVLKIVPLDSPWYTKAYKALNTRAQKRDDDE